MECLLPGRAIAFGQNTASSLRFLRDQGWHVLSVEASTESFAQTPRESPQVKVIVAASLSNALLPASHYEACLLIDPPGGRETIEEGLRLLKPGGILYLVFFKTKRDPLLRLAPWISLNAGPGERYPSWYVQRPFDARDPMQARLRSSALSLSLEGRLVTGSGGRPEDQKVFLIRGGQRLWVTSVAWLEANHMSLADTVQIASIDLESIPEGPALH